MANLIIGGNAYRNTDGVLESAGVFLNGSVDETSWCEVCDFSDPGSRQAFDQLACKGKPESFRP